MIDKTSSIVLVDNRHHRKIAQDNWGLSDEQMQGMHIHHRIPRSKGGTNDASNLYVCSPWFHKNIWHSGQEWIDYAHKGAEMAQIALQIKRETDPEWVKRERERASYAAKRSHEVHRGTAAYSKNQRVKSLRTHIRKRAHWSQEDYDFTWNSHLNGITSGYLIARQRGVEQWKTYANMLKYAILGFSYEQLTKIEEYLKEIERLESSPIAHILNKYDD